MCFQEEDLKRLSMGPLKFAAMNGLSLSRGNIVLEEPSRAPKDERVSIFTFLLLQHRATYKFIL